MPTPFPQFLPDVVRLCVAGRALAAAVLTAGLAAQARMWVVDPQNRPGTDFTTLSPAVTAARDGDAVRVRGGSHPAFVTSKGIALLGEEGAILGAASILNVAAGLQVGVQGFGITSGIDVTNCRGRVLLERVFSSYVAIASADHVVLNSVRLTGAPGRSSIDAAGSTLVLIDCSIFGINGQRMFGPTPALSTRDSFVHVSRGVLAGGGPFLFADSAPGIQVLGGASHRVVLCGDANTVVSAGANSVSPVSAIVGVGYLTYDPRVRLVPATGAPPIAAAVQATAVPLPSLRGVGAPAGGVVTVELASPAGETIAFVCGPPGSRVPLGTIGDLWIDPNLLIVARVGVQGPSEHTSLALTLPLIPELVFLTWCWQGASGATTVRASNPVTYVHH